MGEETLINREMTLAYIRRVVMNGGYRGLTQAQKQVHDEAKVALWRQHRRTPYRPGIDPPIPYLPFGSTYRHPKRYNN